MSTTELKATTALTQPDIHTLFQEHSAKGEARVAELTAKLEKQSTIKAQRNLDLLIAQGTKGEAAAKAAYVAAAREEDDLRSERDRTQEALTSLKEDYDRKVAQEQAAAKANRIKFYDRTKWGAIVEVADKFTASAAVTIGHYARLIELNAEIQSAAPGIIPTSQLNWGGMGSPSFREGAIAQELYRLCHDVVQSHGLQGPLYVLPQPKYDTINNMGNPAGIVPLRDKIAGMRKVVMDHLWGRTLLQSDPAPEAPVETTLADPVLAAVDGE